MRKKVSLNVGELRGRNVGRRDVENSGLARRDPARDEEDPAKSHASDEKLHTHLFPY
jgi:hypothetical protein